VKDTCQIYHHFHHICISFKPKLTV
jgi:hypothetical protein